MIAFSRCLCRMSLRSTIAFTRTAACSDCHHGVLVCESGQRSPLLVSYVHRMCSQLHHLSGCNELIKLETDMVRISGSLISMDFQCFFVDFHECSQMFNNFRTFEDFRNRPTSSRCVHSISELWPKRGQMRALGLV